MTRYIVKYNIEFGGRWTVVGAQRGTRIKTFKTLSEALEFASQMNLA